MRNQWIPIALACAALTMMTGCQARPHPHVSPATADPLERNPGMITQTEPKPIAELLAGKTDVKELDMSASGFSPTEIKAHLNGRVKIHLRNKDTKPHNLVIQRFHIATGPVQPGAEEYIEFTANEAGRWPMISDLPGSPEPGFEAALVVE